MAPTFPGPAVSDWYCSKCGERAPETAAVTRLDPRYTTVEHHGRTYPAIRDPASARLIRDLVAQEEAKRRERANERARARAKIRVE